MEKIYLPPNKVTKYSRKNKNISFFALSKDIKLNIYSQMMSKLDFKNVTERF